MIKINIETISFETIEDSNLNENYPNSGLFMVKVANGTNDLRYVNKNDIYNNYVMPESVFNEVFESQKIVDSFDELKIDCEIDEIIKVPAKYDGDFILEFARILLNRK